MRRDDGVLFICDLIDEAQNGHMPKQVLSKTNKYWFKRQSVGYGRYYAALGVNQQIDLMVNIDYAPKVQIGKYAMLGNGDQYRIDNVQHFDGDNSTRISNPDYLRYTLLTLSKMEKYYDVLEPETAENNRCA